MSDEQTETTAQLRRRIAHMVAAIDALPLGEHNDWCEYWFDFDAVMCDCGVTRANLARQRARDAAGLEGEP